LELQSSKLILGQSSKCQLSTRFRDCQGSKSAMCVKDCGLHCQKYLNHNFCMFSWLAIGWLDPSHMYKIKARMLKYSLSQVKMACQMCSHWQMLCSHWQMLCSHWQISCSWRTSVYPRISYTVTGATILCTLCRKIQLIV